MLPLSPSPRQIFSTLLPHLRVAAAYAKEIQNRVVEQPEKAYPGNFFASALTDADLSVQTFVEVLLLAYFPQLRFYGEEHERTFNTKYFPGIEFPGSAESGSADLLLTLDPIDGTRCYADGFDNYQIILNVLSPEQFEGCLLISPARDRYFCTLRGAGVLEGCLSDALEQCRPIGALPQNQTIYLGGGAGIFAQALPDRYVAYDVYTEYSHQEQRPSMVDFFDGAYGGAILKRANFLDGAAMAFMAQEWGCIVSDHRGQSLPPLRSCTHWAWPGLVIATSPEMHRDLLRTVQVVEHNLGENR